MSRGLTVGTEQVVDLVGLAAGAAAARLVELAKAQGYTVAATAAGTYRLARTRRRLLVDKRTESVVVTVYADRTGTKARIVGPLDEVVIEHLRHGASSNGQLTPPPVSDVSGAAAVPAPTTPKVVQPPPAAPPAHDPAPITAAPPQADPGAWWQPSPPTQPAAPEPDDRTVARSSLRPAGGTPMLVLPGGRSVPLHRPVVVGRNPDPARGGASAVPIAIADPSISKTHATIDVVDGTVWVTDLSSTNGTRVEAHGATAACTPGQRRRVDAGSTIVAGDVRLHVRGAS